MIPSTRIVYFCSVIFRLKHHVIYHFYSPKCEQAIERGRMERYRAHDCKPSKFIFIYTIRCCCRCCCHNCYWSKQVSSRQAGSIIITLIFMFAQIECELLFICFTTPNKKKNKRMYRNKKSQKLMNVLVYTLPVERMKIIYFFACTHIHSRKSRHKFENYNF